MANKKVEQMAFIDVAMVQMTEKTVEAHTRRWTTASQVDTEVQITEGEKKTLIVKGRLISQKKSKDVVTGTEITLNDNTFIPAVVEQIQGGKVIYDQDGNFKSYEAPTGDDIVELPKFDFDIFTEKRNSAGDLMGYAKISFPNCQGSMINISLQDGEFIAPEMKIFSFPESSQAPYTITMVDELPSLVPDEEPSSDELY